MHRVFYKSFYPNFEMNLQETVLQEIKLYQRQDRVIYYTHAAIHLPRTIISQSANSNLLKVVKNGSSLDQQPSIIKRYSETIMPGCRGGALRAFYNFFIEK